MAKNTLSHSRIHINKTLRFSYYPAYIKNLISVRPRVRLQQDKPVQVHMRGTNPKERPTVTRIVNEFFLAAMNNITHLLNVLTEKRFLYGVTC